MDFVKSKLNIIIAIICIILFGTVYVNKINRREVIPATAVPAQTSLQTAAEPEGKVQAATIKVHIMGAVAHPGVYELDEGSRIVDAIAAAGGESADADLERINLAKILHDEMQVKIPREGENVDKTEASVQNNEYEAVGGSALININTAGKSEIMSLPSIGEVTAGNIIAYREANGSFKSVDDIKKVNRIGEKTFEKIKDLITIE